jgi:3D (Asp-Asp-Asp) domain-containing protein
MFRSRAIRRRVLGGVMAAIAVFLLYQATVVDSRSVAGQHRTPADPLRPVSFVATAYCKGETTASGVAVRSGVAAADPKTLPLGSIVRIEEVPDEYQGIYTVLDTGPKVQGRHLDLYMWSCHEALAFGRRPIKVTVLRRGWKPSGD